MKRGTKVAVCHDGKYSRRVPGEVVDTHNGHHIKIRFYHPNSEEPVEFWARKAPAIRYRQDKQVSRYLSIIRLKRAAYFVGWADTDSWCPWYAVYRWRDSPPSNNHLGMIG